MSAESKQTAVPTAATLKKRQQLVDFIERFFVPEPAVRAVIGVGSIAFGTMRPNSDIDAVVFWDPVDPYLVPSEFKWVPASNTFHSIFSDGPAVHETSIQFDFFHHDLLEWSDPNFVWSEGQNAAFVESWLAYDRDGSVARLLAERTAYTAALRVEHLDRAVLDLCEMDRDPTALWESLGAAVALDRTLAAYDALVRGLFAYNGRWRAWRSREIDYLLRLPWLPADFASRVLAALHAPATDRKGFCQRFSALGGLCDDLLAQLADEPDYGSDPIGAAFRRAHDRPGYAHNMDEWSAEHSNRQASVSQRRNEEIE